MKFRGARILLECLKEQGVDTVFGYPGGAVLNIYDELYNFEGITHYMTSHEQGAAHAADGYARATGKVGVVFATSGPGATNLVTGIANAYMDSVPMVAITGQVPTSLIGKDSFQEVDIVGITLPITKHNFIVKDVKDLADTIRKAFRIATTGRKGPVLIDIPKDVTANLAEYEPMKIEKVDEELKIEECDFDKAANLINDSKKIVLMVGGGCNASPCTEEILELQRKLKCPITETMMGLGVIDGNYEMNAGYVGMHGSVASNRLIQKSDLIIVLGARFSDRVISDPKKFATNTKVLHIDIDNAEVSKNIEAYTSLIGDVKKVLKVLNKKVEDKEPNEWTNYARELIDVEIEKKNRDRSANGPIDPHYVLQVLEKETNDDAVITTEVGQHQIWASKSYNYKTPKTFITSGGLGTMGYGLGAAIGAYVGTKKMVFDIAGDGSSLMNINELNTIFKYNLPVKVIVFNNYSLGMVRQWQNLFYEGRLSSTVMYPETSFARIANGFGIYSNRIEKNEDVKDAIHKLVAHDGPGLLEVIISHEEMATPIVPPGKSIDNMMLTD
ncbi:biosynthetic-type acetolactate synthase large subunit [uncultured Clostridium sp.]|uniref:biosynthetic-type acetolactate synthase large subunit n=1 Tax=uncultured Clostridium sp. TaxID=59620 RepID=UPI0025ED24A4|nr:biosynthetic-type acetolactate synthase large subunit [uncultured Clostridium sp.]